MDVRTMLVVTMAFSLVAFGLIAYRYVVPALDRLPRREALMPLVIPHIFRTVGLVFLVPGVVAQSLPPAFARPAAYGDLIAAGLALVALLGLLANWRAAILLVWLFNLFGIADLLYAAGKGLMLVHPPDFGAAWFIPTFIVPVLLVTHVLIFRTLLRNDPDPAS